MCESARNVACFGARPLAITNCLNFGSPERPEVMGDFAASVRGIADACRAFGIPVTGGNVSFYNESPSGAVHPTAIVGMLGVLDDVYAHRPAAAREGDAVVLLGESKPELGGSEALAVIHDTIAGRAPSLDLGNEVALTKLLATPGLGGHACDLSEGGLAVALAEMSIRSACGVRVALDAEPLWELFGESTARALITCTDGEAEELLKQASKLGVTARVIGRMEGDDLIVDKVMGVPVVGLSEVFDTAIPALMER